MNPGSYKEAILCTLDEHPELGEPGHTGPLYEIFDCARSTISHYIGTWRKLQELGFVLQPAVHAYGACEQCEYVDRCRALDAMELPVLCEAVTRDHQELYQHRGVWGDVLRSRLEVGGE